MLLRLVDGGVGFADAVVVGVVIRVVIGVAARLRETKENCGVPPSHYIAPLIRTSGSVPRRLQIVNLLGEIARVKTENR
jgi:hypothetical protein